MTGPLAVAADGLTLDEWLESTQARRDELDAYAVSPMPAFEDRERDIERAIAWGHDCGKLLADAEGYLSHAKATAMYQAKDDPRDWNSKQIDLVVKDSVRLVQRLVDGLCVTNRSIQNRIFALMNANRSRL